MIVAIIIIAIVLTLDSDVFNGFVRGLTGTDIRDWADRIGSSIRARWS